jgi:hypothetical protein
LHPHGKHLLVQDPIRLVRSGLCGLRRGRLERLRDCGLYDPRRPEQLRCLREDLLDAGYLPKRAGFLQRGYVLLFDVRQRHAMRRRQRVHDG